MFEVNNNVRKINGVKGKYDEKAVTDSSERYGRNAVNNYYSYKEEPFLSDNFKTAPILDFSMNPEAPEKNAQKIEKFLKENDEYLNSLPPLEFEYRYMPNIHKGHIDKKALMGAAYEEMGREKEMSVKMMNDNYAPSKDYTFESMDINKDGKIDKAEYSTSILAADLLSKPEGTNIDGVDGTINNKGMNTLQELTKKANAQEASVVYTALYNQYNLGKDN